ncbi:MAG TPA: 4-hydroxy-tetrahydrodipicolinate synthase [Blastocatellia bacterium]|nr:4-hydroxy-tetrahydrodipicolinate synthase [Blastocatellia bacterium]
MTDLNRLHGCGTAIVTPFTLNEEVDTNALRRLVEYQIEGGVDFIVACGTTGESVTLSDDEQLRVIDCIIKAADGRVPVVAGAGGYNTREVIEKVHRYASFGADAILSVTPYYNKPTQEGLYQHYRAIALASEIPVILYSVQGRTGVNLEPATVARLTEFDKIIGIKEASGNFTQIAEIASLTGSSFKIFAGDDSMVLPVCALGGVGVISVTSNLLPRRMSELTHLCEAGRFAEARRLYLELMPVFKATFIESNPIPIKAAMAMVGLIEEVYRLPLVPMSEANRKKLQQVMAQAGVAAETVLHTAS